VTTAYFAGLVAGLSLIIAIGAQNAFVLRQGILRRHVLAVVTICVVADALLIVLGALGAGAVVSGNPGLVGVLRWGGGAYLVWFAITALRAAHRPEGLATARAGSGRSAVVTILALTFLNPHVYLDTVVMLGSIGATFGEGRWLFAGGAVTGSILWFPALALAGRRLAGVLARPRTWQVLNLFIGVGMLGLAAWLVVGFQP
jgi:L-lysine exporter family protein LysE/ArgO